MAKYIKITEEHLEAVREAIMRELLKVRAASGDLNLTVPLGKVERRAVLRITETAMWKMKTLVSSFDGEVAWHGVAKRVEGDGDIYEISDVLVYPQKVSSATVDDNMDEAQAWYDGLPDEVFNNLRMQGHSHVNFSTSPSQTDRDLYKKFLDMLDDTMFYIFMIINKRDERMILIYDLQKNILFETPDVDVKVVEDGSGISKFLNDAKTMVKRAVPAAQSTYGFGAYGSGTYSSGYKDYRGSSYQTGTAGKTATGAAQGTVKSFGSSPADKNYAMPPKSPAQPAPAKPVPQASAPAKQIGRMGKRKNTEKKPGKNTAYIGDYGYYYEDEYGAW